MMKKLGLFLLLTSLFLLLVSCSPIPNMNELLSYQENPSEMTLRITDEKTVFHAVLTIEEEELLLVFTDAEREYIGYRMDKDGQISMVYEDLEILIEGETYLKCKDWFSLFRLSAGENIWKIKKETLGGLEVFCCRDGYMTVYIDSTTRLPIKFQSENTEIDVLSVQ